MVAGTPFDPNYEESKKEGKENIPLEGFHKVFETLTLKTVNTLLHDFD